MRLDKKKKQRKQKQMSSAEIGAEKSYHNSEGRRERKTQVLYQKYTRSVAFESLLAGNRCLTRLSLVKQLKPIL